MAVEKKSDKTKAATDTLRQALCKQQWPLNNRSNLLPDTVFFFQELSKNTFGGL
jgi:hypothetical protein